MFCGRRGNGQRERLGGVRAAVGCAWSRRSYRVVTQARFDDADAVVELSVALKHILLRAVSCPRLAWVLAFDSLPRGFPGCFT